MGTTFSRLVAALLGHRQTWDNTTGDVPHWWDGRRWQCLVCDGRSPDPCDCACCAERAVSRR